MLALQAMVTRQFDVFDPIVLTVGTFHAGTVDNVISDEATFVATIRSFSPQARDAVQRSAPRVCRDVATAHGLTAEAEFVDGYPVTVNDDAEMAFAEQTVADVLGDGRYITAPNPLTGSEDFSYVLDQVPGAFLMLGACPPDTDPFAAPFNHSAEAVFDDAMLSGWHGAVHGTGAAPARGRLRPSPDEGRTPGSPGVRPSSATSGYKRKGHGLALTFRLAYMLATSACLARTASAAARRPASSVSDRSRSTTRLIPAAPRAIR